MIIPFEREYEYVYYYEDERVSYFQVYKYNKVGICDIHGKEIIEPKYHSILYFTDGFGIQESLSGEFIHLNIMINGKGEEDNNTFSKSSLCTDSKTNFKYYEIFQNGYWGVLDKDEKELIPLSRKYTKILFRSINDKIGYFLCWAGDSVQGACNINGKEIVPTAWSCSRISDLGYYNINLIVARKGDRGGIHNSEGIEGLYDLEGKEIIPLSYGFNSINWYKEGYFKCNKGYYSGAYSLEGKELVKPDYWILEYTKNGFEGEIGHGDYQMKKLGVYLPNHKSLFPDPKPLQNNSIANLESNSPQDVTNIQTSEISKKDYGTNSKHGKIINQTSEKQGTVVVRQEWYEDGYYSIFLMDKCKACGGTGRVGYNFCTAGCAGGFLTLLTYYDKNGNEVEKSGNMRASNSSYYGGGSGGSYSGGSASGAGRSSGSSVYTKCTSCNGTGDCSGCNGKRGSWQNTGYYTGDGSKSWINCGSCRGSGKCPICYGRGKL